MNTAKVNRILVLIIISLVAIILAVTAVKVIKTKSDKKNTRIPDPMPSEVQSLNKTDGTTLAAYTGLGTIRARTLPDSNKDSDIGTVVIITPWLSYPDGDDVFYEELSRKRLLITGIIANYFSQSTKSELYDIPEDTIKSTLVQMINEELSLGKIQALYFTDYIFLE